MIIGTRRELTSMLIILHIIYYHSLYYIYLLLSILIELIYQYIIIIIFPCSPKDVDNNVVHQNGMLYYYYLYIYIYNISYISYINGYIYKYIYPLIHMLYLYIIYKGKYFTTTPLFTTRAHNLPPKNSPKL